MPAKNETTNNRKAYLYNAGDYSYFSYGDITITFYTGKNLQQYTAIKEWDAGYLVVTCRNKSNPQTEIEDYIDLVPILENLYFKPDKFLAPIKEVELDYDGRGTENCC